MTASDVYKWLYRLAPGTEFVARDIPQFASCPDDAYQGIKMGRKYGLIATIGQISGEGARRSIYRRLAD